MTVSSYLLGGIASVLVSIPSLHVLANVTHNHMPAFVARFIASFFALIVCACYGVVASVVLRIVGFGGLGQWTTARFFKWSMWALTGVTFDVQDKEGGLKVRPGVFVGNHQTGLDVLMIGCMFPPYCSVTAKSSLKWTPFLGWFMALSKTVFINRSSIKESRAAFSSAVETMHSAKQSVFIFPEGTRSYYTKPEMLPFKKGAFHLAVQAQVPVIPVVTANYSNVLDIKRKIFNAGTVAVSILKPVDTKGMTKDDVAGLTEMVRHMMEAELVKITKETVDQGISRPDTKATGLAEKAAKGSID